MNREICQLHWVLDDDGKPAPVDDALTWARWFEGNSEQRFVRKTLVGEHEVSTVFLGMNYNYNPKGPPILWETMVFPECEECHRHMSREEALVVHEEVVERLKREE